MPVSTLKFISFNLVDFYKWSCISEYIPNILNDFSITNTSKISCHCSKHYLASLAVFCRMRMIYFGGIYIARELTEYSNPLHKYLKFPVSYSRFFCTWSVLIITVTARIHTRTHLLMKCEFSVTVLAVRILWSFCQPEEQEEFLGRNY